MLTPASCLLQAGPRGTQEHPNRQLPHQLDCHGFGQSDGAPAHATCRIQGIIARLVHVPQQDRYVLLCDVAVAAACASGYMVSIPEQPDAPQHEHSTVICVSYVCCELVFAASSDCDISIDCHSFAGCAGEAVRL